MAQKALTSHSVHRATLAIELLALGVLVVPAHALLGIGGNASVGRHVMSTRRILLHPDSWVTHIPLMVWLYGRPCYFLRAHLIVVMVLRRHVATRAPSIAIRLSVSVGLLLLLFYLVLREQHTWSYLFFAARVLHFVKLVVRYLGAQVTLVSRLINWYLRDVSMRDHAWPLLIPDSSVATHYLQALRSLRCISRRVKHLVGHVHIGKRRWRL